MRPSQLAEPLLTNHGMTVGGPARESSVNDHNSTIVELVWGSQDVRCHIYINMYKSWLDGSLTQVHVLFILLRSCRSVP